MKTLIALTALIMAHTASAQEARICEDEAKSAVLTYAKIFCHDYCKIDGSKTKVTMLNPNLQQDEPGEYIVEVTSTITGETVRESYTEKYRVVAGYSRPPIRFGITPICNIQEDIKTLENEL